MTWIEDAATEHLVCRDTGIRHRWEPVHAERDPGGFVETVECLRCGTIKRRWLTKSGQARKTKFEYPDGYVHKGEGRATRAINAAVRMAAFKRRYDV